MREQSQTKLHSIHKDADSQVKSLIARLPKPIKSVLNEGDQALTQLLEQCFSAIDDTLFQLAKNSQKQEDQDSYFCAMRELRSKQKTVFKNFRAGLQLKFSELALPSEGKSANQFDRLSIEDLSIVGNDELDELVAREALVNRANTRYQNLLDNLAQRIDSIALADVDALNQPLGPESLCTLFSSAVKTVDIGTKPTLVLFKLFENKVLENLGPCYRHLNQLLSERGILPNIEAAKPKVRSANAQSKATTTTENLGGLHLPVDPSFDQDLNPSRVMANITGNNPLTSATNGLTAGNGLGAGYSAATTNPGNQYSGVNPAQGTSSGSHSSRGQASSQNLSANALHQAYAQPGAQASNQGPVNQGHLNQGPGHQAANTTAGLASDESGTAYMQSGIGGGLGFNPQVFNQLTRFMPQFMESANSQDSHFLSRLIHGLEAELGLNIPLQSQEQNLVSMVDDVIAQIGGQAHFPAPLQSVLQQLHLPIAKLASSDEQFIYSNQHSGRQLVNQLITASLECENEDPDRLQRDPLFNKIKSIVEVLSQSESITPKLLSSLQQDFSLFRQQEERRAKLLDQRVASAEQGRIKSEKIAAIVDTTIREVCQGMTMVTSVAQLINQAWRQVLIFNGLKFGVDSAQWDGSLETLIDLVTNTQNFANATDRGQAIAQLPDLKKRIISSLNEIGFDRFKAEMLISALELTFKRLTQLKQNTKAVEPEKAKSREQVSAHKNLNKIKHKVEVKVKEQEQPTHNQDRDNREEVAEAFVEQAKSLGRGTWFEWSQENQKQRCRLAAVINDTQTFIFVSRNGSKLADKPLHEVALALQQQTLVPMDSNQLFDRALEDVISAQKRKAHSGS